MILLAKIIIFYKFKKKIIIIIFVLQNIECSMILRDGNNTIYPIAKDCADAIRDPNWLDLVPVNCIGAATIPISSCSNSSNLKNQVAVIALAFDNLLLMPRILRCDYESVKQVFCNLEQDLSKYINIYINVIL